VTTIDFFRKIFQSKKGKNYMQPINYNVYLLEILHKKIEGLGHQSAFHQRYYALLLKNKLEIATEIIDNPENHKSILQLKVVVTHPEYFPEGIFDCLVGLGDTMEDKIDSVIDNFLNANFQPIINSQQEFHNPKLDFTSNENGKEILWHVYPSHLLLQGSWQQEPLENILLDYLQSRLTAILFPQKMNWLKIYISRQPSGEIIGECILNNQPWEEGLEAITEYAQSWDLNDKFLGMKQFIVFKRCDTHNL
jgi:hypothetical protein